LKNLCICLNSTKDRAPEEILATLSFLRYKLLFNIRGNKAVVIQDKEHTLAHKGNKAGKLDKVDRVAGKKGTEDIRKKVGNRGEKDETADKDE